MLEAYGQALAFLFQPMTLVLMTVAVIIGLVIGIIPGIGGMLGVALMLPLLFGMPKETALTFLVAFHAVTFTGGSITAILVNIPGTGPNAATTLDGFPMNQRGEGARAIGAALNASMLGGIVPCFLALAMVPLILPVVMAFKTAEMAALVLVAIASMGALTGRSAMRGLISGVLGVLMATIGFQGVTGVYRFTFGSSYLYDGLGIVVVALGLFGLTELLEMAIKGQASIATGEVKSRLSDVFVGCMDVFRHWWLWLRATIIGYIIGILPGVGAETAIWVAYGHAKQTSKHPETFGTGNIEGVIAPESANNSKEAGDLLTTMAFGIPGGPVMALYLGAFLMVGVIPGPRMLIDHLPLALTLLLGIALANLIGGVICIFSAPYLAKVASVRLDLLFPLVISLILVGGFADRSSMTNLIVIIFLGVLGLFMKRYHFSRPSLLVGLVLGRLLEDYILRGIQLSGPLFFVTPISLALLAVLALTLAYPFLQKTFASKGKRAL
ncbi:MAG: tripartite tricarboxylate transporter permease [Chloroflexota bacterium]